MTSDTFLRQSPVAICGLFLALAFLGPPDCKGQDNASHPPSSSASTQEQPSSNESKDSKPVDPGMTRLRIHVTNDHDKPVANASVYVRFNVSGGLLHHDKLAELNFKTNQDGSVKVPEVPQGKILIQVIATGWHTFGQWYDVEKEQETITIKLAPPPHWY